MGERLAGRRPAQPWQDVIHSLEAPLKPAGALVALTGSLFPDGAIMKAATASPELMRHRGRAVVFDFLEDVEARIDDPALDVTWDSVMVLRNIGPVASGMPEAGAIPIPKKLARVAIRDMVRVSDGRMSGTAYGTVVLHGAPEMTMGGPIALVRDGDEIVLDVDARRIDLLVDGAELGRRRAALPARTGAPMRGWRRLASERVQRAHVGAELDFL
jgi:dihydroxy-acid dehydratase